MKKFSSAFLIIITSLIVSSCARDLGSANYTSDSTLNVALKGKVLSKRAVNISEKDKLSDNQTGMLAGALGGGALGATLGSGKNSGAAAVGGALVGAFAGALTESALGTSKGTEYIVQVDKSHTLKDERYEGSRTLKNALSAVRATGIITVLQGQEGNKKNPIINEGQEVLVIISEKRTRIIPTN